MRTAGASIPRSLTLFLALAAVAIAAAQTEKIRNDRVVVVEERLQPGEMKTLRGTRPSVTVYLTDGTLEVTAEAGKPSATKARRGDAAFQAAQARNLKNTGSAEVHFALIEFAGSGRLENWGAAGLSPNYKLLFENPYARVYDIRIPAGTKEPQHSHHDRVVVCLSGARLSHLLPDGREEPSTLRTGEIAWRRGGTHIGQNLGNTDLWVIAVEPK